MKRILKNLILSMTFAAAVVAGDNNGAPATPASRSLTPYRSLEVDAGLPALPTELYGHILSYLTPEQIKIAVRSGIIEFRNGVIACNPNKLFKTKYVYRDLPPLLESAPIKDSVRVLGNVFYRAGSHCLRKWWQSEPIIKMHVFFDCFNESLSTYHLQKLEGACLAQRAQVHELSWGFNISDNTIRDLFESFPRMKKLTLTFCQDLTDTGIKALEEEISHDLCELNLIQCLNVTEDALHKLAAKRTSLKIKALRTREPLHIADIIYQVMEHRGARALPQPAQIPDLPQDIQQVSSSLGSNVLFDEQAQPNQ